MRNPNKKEIDDEIDRLMKLTDEEIKAEHLKLYGGNKRLAKKSLDMIRAEVQGILSKHWKQ